MSVTEESNRIEILVKDNGVGIPPENIDKLFLLDKTVTTIGTSLEKGTGLGLVLCKEFVTRNKGSISVLSKPGVGTEFFVRLPKNIDS